MTEQIAEIQIEQSPWDDSIKNINKKHIKSNKDYDKILYELYQSDTKLNNIKNISIGDNVSGTIHSMDENIIHMDVMGKYSVQCENELMVYPDLEAFTIGSTLEVTIIDENKLDGIYKGSISSFMQRASKETLLLSLKNNTPVLVKVIEATKGGFIVNYHDMKMFMPFTLANINKVNDVDDLLNKEIYILLDSYDQKSDSFIASHRAWLESQQPEKIKQLEKNGLYEGSVIGTTKFGIFVQFNDCLVGMIHKDNVIEEYRDKLSEIEIGTEIEFYFKEIVKDRIILTQFLRESLWDILSIGDIYEGTITKSETYGTFVKLDEETRGLIGINELKKSGKTFNPGDKVKVRVSSIIYDSKKIILSLLN